MELLTGKPLPDRPQAPLWEGPQQIEKYERQYRDRLVHEVAERRAELQRANASAPKGAVPGVDPRPMYAEKSYVVGELTRNPHVQAIKGRKGFPTKAEQKELAEWFFREGGRLAPAPWGRGQGQAAETAREILAQAFASRSRGEQTAVIRGAREQLALARQDVARLQKELAAGSRQSSEVVAGLRSDFEAAKQRAEAAEDWVKFYKGILDKILPRGDGG
jgi:hypothetical protein